MQRVKSFNKDDFEKQANRPAKISLEMFKMIFTNQSIYIHIYVRYLGTYFAHGK